MRIFLFTWIVLFGVQGLFATPLSGKKKEKVTAYIPVPDKMPQKARPGKRLPACVELSRFANFSNITREGLDVSHYQGKINWEEVVQNDQLSYVYLKSTEGETLVDDTYRTNLTGAKRAGLKVGSYHFYRSTLDVDKQFLNMIATVKKEEQDLLPIIDVENIGRGISPQKFIRDLTLFLEKVESHYGKKPIIYTFYNFYNKYLVRELKGYKWMIARYHEDMPVLSDGQDYVIWQYTSSGRIKGIRGNVDRSLIMPDYSLSDILY